ncbi:glutamate-5-semialdehyde dehydrogenase [Paremcibacter congregatus]|uniref:glutamate-5-semialdehyde dehydrogenase n=1 Tax=Paremcibacter congregatus TaxID=2043170 RepID=UPI0030EBB6CE|tara:strand:- start:168 stop:1436 length:1269 start_codon:yes stop_codon:yes gene_type:complete
MTTEHNISTMMQAMGQAAKTAAQSLALATTDQKNAALQAAAQALRAQQETILKANARDMEIAEARHLAPALLDRLMLDPARIEAMAGSLDAIALLPDPVGDVMAAWDRPNGLNISRVRVPLGVIGIIYESRPNVTADAGALCLKSGNAAILRGGSESARSSKAIHDCLKEGLRAARLPEEAIQVIPTQDRAAVGELLGLVQYVDIIVPRGGKSLIERVQQDSRVPVMAHLDGICHVYIDKDADLEKAVAITLNAKMRRTGICGATETLLVDQDVLDSHLPTIIDALKIAGCELRGDKAVQALDESILPAQEADWTTEYLDAILSIRTVDGVTGAIDHIARYGSQHTDCIITENAATAEIFLTRVDSAIVMHNSSTQFADGGEFGMGAEIGISTGKMHARGPVGLEQLTSYKYQVRGDGQTRP